VRGCQGNVRGTWSSQSHGIAGRGIHTWSMAGGQDSDAPVHQEVSTQRDAYVAGRDLHVHLAGQLRAEPEAARAGAGQQASARLRGDDVAALMRAQARAADELPHRLFGVRRPSLSSVYVRQVLGGSSSPGLAPAGAPCSVDAAFACHRHLIVIGGPGQGKSTLTLELVHRLARDWLTAPGGPVTSHLDPADLVPLRVTGRQLAASLHQPWLQTLGHAVRAELGSHLDYEIDVSSGLLAGPVTMIVSPDGKRPAVKSRKACVRVMTTLVNLAGGVTGQHRLPVNAWSMPKSGQVPAYWRRGETTPRRR
jgi:hypothetical protein